MVLIKKFWYWLTTPYRKWKEHRDLQKRLQELKEKDPFIYK